MLHRLLLIFWIVTLFPQSVLASFANRPEVERFITEMVHKHHFARSNLIALFNQVKIKPIIIQSVKAPLEQKPWYTYQALFLTQERIQKGVLFWKKYEDVLEKIENKYGVPASIIVATIGVETTYGKNIGEYRVIDALSNIAFSESPRASFFRHELEEFLLLTQEQHLNPLQVMGSYAGAIGQPQFMPSSYRYYAVSFSGHSKIDLSYNEKDVMSSIANYYQKHGWEYQAPIAAELHIQQQPFGFLTHMNQPIIPRSNDQKANLIELQGMHGKEYWLSYRNFDVIKRYNSSNLYAMAVYQLSYQIALSKGNSDHA